MDSQLQQALAEDLNAVIQRGPIHEPQRFGGVALLPEALKLLGQNPRGDDLVRLNRLLLEDVR